MEQEKLDSIRNKKLYPRLRNKKQLKQVMIAFSSAILIGSFFGVFILQMIKQDKQGESPQIQTAAETVGENLGEKAVDKITVSVIQAGVFTDMLNAKEWENKFENAGYPTVSWPRAEQVYLFAGLYDSADSAKKAMEKIKEVGLDVFVKEWVVEGKTLELSKSDEVWLTNFIKLWKESLEKVNQQDSEVFANWTDLPAENEGMSDRINALSNEVDQLITNNHQENQFILLQLLQKYEQIILAE